MIGFIGGGNMGEAIIRGILQSKIYKNKDIIVSDISSDRLNFLEKNYKISTTDNNFHILEKSNIVILSVKPQIIDNILNELKNNFDKEKHIVISIAAGISISKIENIIGNNMKIIRVMPNAAAFALESMSALCFNENINNYDKEKAGKIFSAIGSTVWLDENQIDAVTALSGSGPGFVSLILESFSDAGVNIGLPRDIADKLILQTFKGTLKLIEDSDKSFIDIKNMVTSPGGTTIAGIKALENGSFKAAIMNCVETAYKKSKELS